MLGITEIIGSVVTGHNQQVLALFLAQISDVCTESGVAALVIDGLFTVDIYGSFGVGTHEFHKYPAATKRLLGGGKCLGIPALAAVISAVAIVAVHSIPGVGQVHVRPCCRVGSRQTGIFPDKLPVFIDVNNVSH